MFNGKIHHKWSFSIAISHYQRVSQMAQSINYAKNGDVKHKCGDCDGVWVKKGGPHHLTNRLGF